jgi:hypothetical protein
MDRRVHQDQNENVKKVVKEREIELIVPKEELIHTSSFKESFIYNLTQKLLILNSMKQKYDLKLQQVETFPAFAKFYVHIPRMLYN